MVKSPLIKSAKYITKQPRDGYYSIGLWMKQWKHEASHHKPGHLFIGFLSHGKYMRVHVPHVLPTVGSDDVVSIDWQGLIRVDGHQDDS